MTKIADALSNVVSFGRRAVLRRWLWGGAAVTTCALGLVPAASASEANRALLELEGQGVRVVVTGNNAAGKSYVVKDTRIKSGEIWRTLTDMPLGGAATDQNTVLPAVGVSAAPTKVVSRWFFQTTPATNRPFNRAALDGIGMHRTSALGYCLVVSGEVTLALDIGEVVLRTGEMVITRNVMHAWHNDGPASLLITQLSVG